MALDLNLLGSKLRKYREQFQASLAEVAQATGIPEESLAAFERGQRGPTGDQVLILADYYKCDYKFFISNERVAAFEETETLFRSHGGDFSKDDRWAVQEFLFLCECEQFLMNALPGHERSSFEFRKEGDYYKGHGEQAAERLRRHLGYAPNEIPPDVYRDFRQIGLHVFRRQLANSQISGLYIRHPSAGRCTLVNYSEDVYRQRFSAAHEAGHAILDSDRDFVVSFAEGQWGQGNLSEVRANTFASRYLLPPESLGLIPEPGKWDTGKAVQWAKHFRVSTEALAYALSSAGLISPGAVELIRDARVPASDKVDPELAQDLSPGFRERRRDLLRRGLSGFYAGLCFDAYEAGIISAGRLADMLLVDPRDLDHMSSAYGRSVSYAD